MSGPTVPQLQAYAETLFRHQMELRAALIDAIRAMSAHGLYGAADRAKTVLEAGL